MLKQADEAVNEKNTFTANRDFFYHLIVNGDHGAPRGSMKVKKSDGTPIALLSQEEVDQLDPKDIKTIYGNYEPVIFLGAFVKCPVVRYHKRRQNKEEGKKASMPERILSYSTFAGVKAEDCPANRYVYSFPKDERKKAFITGALSTHIFPVLAYRRQKDPDISSKGMPVQPVHWFEVNSTNYIADYYSSWKRLKQADEVYPVHKYMYQIFAEKREQEKKQQFYFVPMLKDGKPIPLNSTTIPKLVTTDHPFVQDWIEDGKFIWDDDYYRMVCAFALLKFSKFVHPETSEVFDYDGYYDEAIQIYEQYRDSYPPPVEKSEEESVTEDDDGITL